MKLRTCFLFTSILILVAGTAAAQGPSKIGSCQTITQPGSYVVTKNLVAAGDCVVLKANYVSLDLGGFVITGDGTGSGITSPQAVKGLVIHDGTIINFGSGIRFCEGPSTVDSAENVTVLRMQIYGNVGLGVRICGKGAIVKDTNASGNGEFGILIDGERSVISGNVANGNSHYGIFLGPALGGSSVIGNTADNNNADGFVVGPGTTFMNNTARENGHAGLQVTCPSNVLGNTLTGNGLFNIQPVGAGCLVDHDVIAP